VNKIAAVLKREYLSAVRKKMFIFMTLFFPVLMAGLMFIPIMMMAKSFTGKRVAVIDGTGRLTAAFSKPLATGKGKPGDLSQSLDVEYIGAHGQDVQVAAKPILTRLAAGKQKSGGLDAILLVPADAFENPKARMTFYSRSSTDIMTQERLASAANRAVQRQRLAERGLGPEQVDTVMRQVPVEGVQLSRTGEQKKGGELNFLFAFVLAALLVVPAFIYGLEIMRGIVQEKSDRVVEVLISSMTPFELLTGKISGVALVGLTQVTVWMLILAGFGAFGAAVATNAGINILQVLRPVLFVYFIVFFLLGYLTYVCVYAVAGAACNTDKEAQQLMAPIQMVMMLPWFMMMDIITNPDSSL
jgi:ABC-2 type transport system permease protein